MALRSSCLHPQQLCLPSASSSNRRQPRVLHRHTPSSLRPSFTPLGRPFLRPHGLRSPSAPQPSPRAQANGGSSRPTPYDNDDGSRFDPLLGDSGMWCPVPEEQQPINEYQSLLESPGFPWVTLEPVSYALRLAGVGLLFTALIGWPVSSLTFDPERQALQCLLGSLGGGEVAVTLAALRLYLGWSYIGSRLFSATVEYEETGWYDGQVWVKTPELLARDRLLASYQVKPVLTRLKTTLLGLGLSLVATTALLFTLPADAPAAAANARALTPASFSGSPAPRNGAVLLDDLSDEEVDAMMSPLPGHSLVFRSSSPPSLAGDNG